MDISLLLTMRLSAEIERPTEERVSASRILYFAS